MDDIYNIQGLAGGKWYSIPDPFDCERDEDEEEVTITENIKITIIVERY